VSLTFEFHDARIASVLLEPGRTLITFSTLCLSDGLRTWFQPAVLELGSTQISGNFPDEEENDLQSGELLIGDQQFRGVVPLPLAADLPVQLTLEFLWGGQFVITATGCTLRL
jgi:hypothetical protein